MLGAEGVTFVARRRQPRLGSLELGPTTGQARLTSRQVALGRPGLPARLVCGLGGPHELRADAVVVGGETVDHGLLAVVPLAVPEPRLPLVHVGELLLEVRHGALPHLDLRARLGDGALELRALLPLEAAVLLVERDLVLEPEQRLLALGQGPIALREVHAHGLHARVLGGHLGLEVVHLLPEVGGAALEDAPHGPELQELVTRAPELEVRELILVVAVALRLLRLSLQHGETRLELGDDVGDAQEVLLGLADLPLSGRLLQLELRDPRGLVDERAPVLRLGGDDLPHAALLDDGVAALADARPHEHVVDVAQTTGDLVDQVLAGAIPEEPTRDADLRVVGVGRGDVPLVLEGDRHLGHPGLAARGGAAEDHVPHARAAQVLRALLAETPPDGVDDIRLAATVGTDDAGDALIKEHRLAVCKGLEAVNFDLLDTHARRGRGGEGARGEVGSGSFEIASFWIITQRGGVEGSRALPLHVQQRVEVRLAAPWVRPACAF